MPPRGSFERRLLLTLVLFSLVPSLLLLGLGSYAISEIVALTGSPAAWERAAESGREVIEEVERTGNPELGRAAERHRDELSTSLLQARRWDYLLRRSLPFVSAVALLSAFLLFALALRSARTMARGLARPIHELVGWSERIARAEPLPPARPDESADAGEFGRLRSALRQMADDLAEGRARALEAERMRSWMGMARRVAHELKNPLTPIRLAIHALARSPVDDPRQHEAIEVLSTEADRLDELARSFAQFGRQPEGPRTDIDLRELLDYLLRTHLPPQVEAGIRAPADLSLIRGHHDALERAFANLILNAADALGDMGGTVRVELDSAPSGMIEVRVRDTGPGIASEHLERIWEPDFTTKRRGTGLGLALVRQTVQAHGGSVWARNRAGGGAEFGARLPTGQDRASNDEPDAGARHSMTLQETAR